MRGGALSVRVITISRSPASFISVSFFFASISVLPLASMGLLLFFELFDELVQFVEARIPELAIALEPDVKLLERLRAQLVKPLLCARLHLDQPRILEHAQVFADLRLIELEALPDLV